MNKLFEIEKKLKFQNYERISSVFVFYRNIKKTKSGDYYNFYNIEFINNGKKYFIRSHGENFCILPYYFFKNNRNKVYSIGTGLYQEKEITVILIESFWNSFKEAQKEKISLENQLNSIDSVIIKRKISERINKFWLNISIIMK